MSRARSTRGTCSAAIPDNPMTALSRLRFLWNLRKSRFANALAHSTSDHRGAMLDRKLWALRHLGMHDTVAELAAQQLGWRGLFAKAVASAARGEATAARAAVAELLERTGSRVRRVALATELAPFLPDVALEVLATVSGPPIELHTALLLRNGLADQALDLLGDDDRPVLFGLSPELYLLRTNAWGGAPADQLRRLNAFLAAYRLAPIELVDASKSPSPTNVFMGVQRLASLRGGLVSVIMTAFNAGERVLAAIRSVLEQSYRDVEVIVVDDASTDDTPRYMRELAARDDRVRFIQLRQNVGTYAAKHVALMLAKGEFVTCHDADDWSHPEKIARQVRPLQSDPELVATVSCWVRMQDDGVFYARPVYPLMRINPSSPMFRRQEVLARTGAWDVVRTGADSEFLARLRLVFGHKAVRKIAEPLALGSHRPGSLMTDARTGYSACGMSRQRLQYWEAWCDWHISTLRQKGRLYIPLDPLAATRDRPFPVPDGLRVFPEEVQACLPEVAQGG